MKNLLIGYDIGTKTVKAVYGTDIENYSSIKLEHYSDPQGVITKIAKKINANDRSLNGYVAGRYKESIKWNGQNIKTIDWTKPVIRYCNDLLNQDIRYIIDIGAAGLSLLELKDGKFHRFATNSICASGTGSFLDQQMIRMGLSFEAVDKMEVTKRVPSIASRCAVFAKSDLIHRQQEGFTIQELWNGLVKGMAEACFITLLRGDNIEGKILFIGGLVKNHLFLHYFSQLLEKDTLVIPDKPDVFLALANFYYADLQSRNKLPTDEDTNRSKKIKKDNNDAFERPLNPEKSSNHENYKDSFGNEITIYETLEKIAAENNRNDSGKKAIPAIMGVDIGSTSTKAAIIHNETGELLLGLYRKTHGNPVSAYQKLLKGINRLTLENPYTFDIKGMGTTGSGRKIVGAFAGADQCVNEITAHLKGALREVPNVRTIFEIGGQDSKYIFVEDGWMKDANMNYVCAAGTGSFLEEQAQNLNFELNEFEELCRGVPAPKTNDRCTVFMEQDSKKLLIDGHSKSEVVASLLYSVCRNYLHRVVQNRPIEEPILFLGATARNKGLVEAFSNILGKQINTSKNSHLTGAIGVAEIVRKDIQDSVTGFKGFSLHSDVIVFKERICTDCHNNCRIIYFDTEAGTVSWGYQCGKEGVDKEVKAKERSTPQKDYFQIMKQINQQLDLSAKLTTIQQDEDKKQAVNDKEQVKPLIHIPKSLYYYSHNSLWQSFWEKLGFKIKVLPDSNKDILAAALAYSPNEICFPLKLAIGHIIFALKNNDLPLFVPYLIKDTKNEAASNSYFCPMTQSLPAIIKSILQYNDLSDEKIFTPIIDLSNTDEYNINSLWGFLRGKIDVSKDRISSAFKSSLNEYISLQKSLYDKGLKIMEELTTNRNPYPTDSESPTQKPSLVIIGRSYNLYDNSLNLGLIKDTKAYGFSLLPADLVPVKRENIGDEYRNMYWAYGQKVIAIAKELNKHPNLYPIFLTNFNCGPDSFILSMLESIWQDKPSLVLELDEHSGNAGYLTRIEAFLDRIKAQNVNLSKQNIISDADSNKAVDSENDKEPDDLEQTRKKTSNSSELPCYSNIETDKKAPLLIPPMNPKGALLVSAAFKSHGYNAIPLLKEDLNTFHLGKSYLRGSECLPAASTLGSVIDYCSSKDLLNNKDSKAKQDCKEAELSIFMPCASGPCRFGQYSYLHKMILERNNLSVEMLSVNSENDYAGFPISLRIQLFKSIILTDILIKLGTKLRPYENQEGSVDELLNTYLEKLTSALENKQSISAVLKSLRISIDKLNINPAQKKPLVGIVGEIYVRSSPFSNDNLIAKVEDHSAEAWLTPFMEWLHYTGHLKTLVEKPLLSRVKENLSSSFVDLFEANYYKYFKGILSDRKEPEIGTMIEKAKPYISDSVRGEAVLTVGRSLCFIEQGARMIVNVAPFGCMPGTISSIILKNIAHQYSIPIVSLYYDGYVGFDMQLEQYLNNIH